MPLNINGTTGISGVDGSVSAPAVTGTDSNTGITFPAADTIKFATNGVERMSITNSGVNASGHIIQVLQQVKSDTASTSSATFATLITKDITRSSASNKVLVSFHVMVSSGASSVPVPQFNLQRGSTNLAQPAVTSSNPATRSEYTFANSVSSISFEFLDDGAASESSLTLTYNLQWARSGTGTAYLGRYFGSVNYNAPSILILKEVAA